MRAEGKQLTATAFSADGRRYAAGGNEGVIRVWNLAGTRPVAVLRTVSRVDDIGFGATNDRVVNAGDDGTVRTWDAGRTVSWLLPSRSDSVDFSADGRFVVTGSEDGGVRLWDAASGRLRGTVPGPAGYTAARFSPTADKVAIARDARSSVAVWSLAGAAPTQVVQLAKGRGMYAARFDGSGRRIVYVDSKGAIAIRDLRTRRDLSLRGAGEAVFDAQFSPDGNHVAATTQSGRIPIWRLDRPAKPERVLTGHGGFVYGIAYGRDGRLVSADADRTVRVWNPSGGPEVVLRGHTDEVNIADFTRDGHVLSASPMAPCGCGTATAALRSPCCSQAVSMTSRRAPTGGS